MEAAEPITISVYMFVILGVLLALSAFFSGSETGLLGIDWLRLQFLARKGNKKAKTVERLLNRKDVLIGTILVGNNLVNIAASAIATAMAVAYFGPEGIAIATGAMTLFVLIFSEVAPKTFASQHSEKVALTVGPVFYLLSKLMYPVVIVVTFLAGLVLKVFGADPGGAKRRRISEEEIRHMLTHGADASVVAENKRKMLHGIFTMGKQDVREVMVPRPQVRALEITASPREVIDFFRATGYTRAPVYRDGLDDIAGIVHVRDVLELASKEGGAGIASIMMDPFFVPDTMNLETLMVEFQKKHFQMAVVVDEYGGVEGVITLEDILEEIVGEIRDEHDIEGEGFRFLSGGKVLVQGEISIREVNAKLGLNLPTDVDVTLGGFVMTMLGHIPEAGDTLKFDGAKFRVERAGKRRAITVRITPGAQTAE